MGKSKFLQYSHAWGNKNTLKIFWKRSFNHISIEECNSKQANRRIIKITWWWPLHKKSWIAISIISSSDYYLTILCTRKFYKFEVVSGYGQWTNQCSWDDLNVLSAFPSGKCTQINLSVNDAGFMFKWDCWNLMETQIETRVTVLLDRYWSCSAYQNNLMSFRCTVCVCGKYHQYEMIYVMEP